jgi:hypothetical protein
MKGTLFLAGLSIAVLGVPLIAAAQVPVRVEPRIPEMARPQTYPLMCRGTTRLSVSARPQRIALLIFTRGTRPSTAGLQPGECSWIDRGVSAAEPNVVAHHIPQGADGAAPYLWTEALWAPNAYWTFEVYNDGRGSLVAVGAYATVLTASGTAVKIERPSANEIRLRAATLASLELKLSTFASALTGAERQVWLRLMRNAALAPTEDPRSVPVQPILNRPGTPGGPAPDHLVGIIAEAGREGIGPKQDDPVPPAPSSTVAIGPKQDDPSTPGVARKLFEFSTQLSAEERGGLDWLLSRASSPGPKPGTPGGTPPELSPSLRQALGIDPLAIGPKQDDPRPPAPDGLWVLRY